MSRTLSPPLKWHGGKKYLARRIHEIADRATYSHRVITHAGGLGELWSWRYEGVSEVVNDIDSRLTNFWSVLRDPVMFPLFLRMVQAAPVSEPLYAECEKSINDESDPVTSAFRFFVVVRQSMAGRMGSFTPLSRTRVRRGMNEQASAWLNSIEGMPAVHARLSRVVIFNKDAVEVIRQQDGKKTLFYCDPTYLKSTRTSKDVYAYEMDRGQHRTLLRTLARIEGKFILSGYDSKLYRKFEAKYGWRRHEFDLPNNASSAGTKKRMREVVWTNFD